MVTKGWDVEEWPYTLANYSIRKFSVPGLHPMQLTAAIAFVSKEDPGCGYVVHFLKCSSGFEMGQTMKIAITKSIRKNFPLCYIFDVVYTISENNM